MAQQVDSVETSKNKKWFIALPLRFTQLQDQPTMLSGIRLGRCLTEKFSLSLSIYHSFYLKSFRAKASLTGFEEQPRLFINGVGIETEYCFLRLHSFSFQAELYMGWGFMKYDLKAYDFRSKQLNYWAIEPALSTTYRINPSTSIGLGIGYRPIISKSNNIAYSSQISNGSVPVHTNLPNGLNITLALKGYL